MKLSIIIVSYNTRDLLLACLKSVEEATWGLDGVEIIVVDNGSTDGTVTEITNYRFSITNRNIKLKIIENKENLGFAAANNIGIRASTGRYILLLNSDTIVFPKTLSSMIRFIESDDKVGVATCKVELPDGTLDPACHRGFPTPWASLTYFLGLERLFPKSKVFGQYHLGFLPMDKPHEIDSPSGAFYLIRKEVIDKVGLLDEDYFMYGEDLDWSYRIKQAGFKIMYYPYAKIIHFKKQSGRAGEDAKTKEEATIHFYETMKIFYSKHYRNKHPGWLTNLIFWTIEIKKKLTLVRNKVP